MKLKSSLLIYFATNATPISSLVNLPLGAKKMINRLQGQGQGQGQASCPGMESRKWTQTNKLEHADTYHSVALETPRGGGEAPGFPMSTVLPSAFAISFLTYNLVKSIRRIVPIAFAPIIGDMTLTPFQQAIYIINMLYFAYAEGYKGFQKKLGPLVVSRSLTLDYKTSPLHHVIFGSFYSMGYFHATKKRKILSISVSSIIVLVIIGVKRLPSPWKNIIDGGVVVGLSWGVAAIVVGYLKAILSGVRPTADPCLPLK